MFFFLLAACGMSQSDFEADFPAEFCAWAEACASDSTGSGSDPLEATCEDAMILTLEAYANDESCTFDSSLADACFETMSTTGCDEYDTVVDACNAVYTGSSCNLTLGDYL
jgi:hypothetical protein